MCVWLLSLVALVLWICCFLCFTSLGEEGYIVLGWSRLFSGILIKSVFNGGAFFVCMVVWLWPVWCGDYLGAVVVC